MHSAAQVRPLTLSASVQLLFDTWAEIKPLTFLGLLGLALALICSLVAAVHGVMIAPEGDLTKAMTFDFAVGIYLLTIALFVPLAGFTAKGRTRWLGWICGLIIYAYGVETIQILRGIDPRFSKVASPLDQIVGLSFFIAALGVIVTFVVLAVKVIRHRAVGADGLMLLGFRYASLATAIGFGGGLWMSAVQGRNFGPAGNILPLHALGFHALQGIPIVAWLLGHSGIPPETARKWIHVSGLAWIAACLLVAFQTGLGRPATEASPAIVLAAIAMLAWMATFLRSARAWRA